MRILTGAAALALGLIVAGQACAGNPTDVKTRSSSGLPFSLDITRFFRGATASAFGRSTSSTTTPTAVPIARPQQVSRGNTSLSNFLPKITSQSASPILGLSTYPTEAQMPGAAYLKMFGARVAPRVPLN